MLSNCLKLNENVSFHLIRSCFFLSLSSLILFWLIAQLNGRFISVAHCKLAYMNENRLKFNKTGKNIRVVMLLKWVYFNSFLSVINSIYYYIAERERTKDRMWFLLKISSETIMLCRRREYYSLHTAKLKI